MNQSIIATRYAKSLIMVGNDNNCLEALKTDMELLAVSIGENPVFRNVLENPVIKPPQKRRVMAELLEKRVHPMTLNLINIVIRNRRELLLSDVARNFIDMYEKQMGIKRAHVVSATGMNDRAKQQIQQQLKRIFNADILMTEDEDPSLIGGFILRVGDQQYNASMLSALERMRKKLVEN